MHSIGIRVTTSEIYYSIFKEEEGEIDFITKDKINQPAAYNLPQVLTYYKQHLESIFKEHNIKKCGIKLAEPISGRMGRSDGNKIRMYIEGMLFEATNSNGIPLVYGPFATFSALHKIKKADDYLKVEAFYNVPNWNKTNKNYKEASLAGVGVLL